MNLFGVEIHSFTMQSKRNKNPMRSNEDNATYTQGQGKRKLMEIFLFECSATPVHQASQSKQWDKCLCSDYSMQWQVDSSVINVS